MAKRPEPKGTEGTKKAGSASTRAVPTIAVFEGDKTPHDELMKLPKAQIVRQMSVPENRTRFMLDVNNRTAKGKRIIALMESLRDGDSAALEKVTDNLQALASTAAKKPASKK